MKSLRCSLGIHRFACVEGFPLGSSNALIVAAECERCGLLRCFNNMYRPTMNAQVKTAFQQAKTWMEEKTGQRIFGSFVRFR